MNKTHRISIFLLIIILLFTSLYITKSPTAYAAAKTDVNLRMVIKYSGSYALCNVTLKRYPSMTAEQPLMDDSFTSGFTIRRINNWEYTLKLEPGFYEVDYVSIPGIFDLKLTGYSKRFEVKGDQMTVYVAVDNEKDPVQMPDNWLVYGEDEQDFHIWHPETEPTTPSEPTSPSDPDASTPTIPDIDTDVEPNPNEPSRPTKPNTPTNPVTPNDNQHEKSESAKIGDIIFLILIALILIVSILYLYHLKRRRGA